MTNSKIQRTVHGEPADPKSTRDLAGFTSKEMSHLKLCLIGAVREAQAFQVMSHNEMRMLLGNSNQVSAKFDIATFDLENFEPDNLREFFAEREKNQAGLLAKLREVEGEESLTITGITPKEYEHLVTSLQASLREAMIYSTLEAEEIIQGIENVSAMFVVWGLDKWDHYDQWKDRWPEFFSGREEILTSILEAVNQPYPGYDYDPLTSQESKEPQSPTIQ